MIPESLTIRTGRSRPFHRAYSNSALRILRMSSTVSSSRSALRASSSASIASTLFAVSHPMDLSLSIIQRSI